MVDGEIEDKMSIIIEALKKKYFEIAPNENYPNTPEITKQLDTLENKIKQEQGW